MTDSTICGFDPCDRPLKTKGLCQQHYKQQWRGQELKPLHSRRSASPICSFDGCENPTKSRGWCVTHYLQWWKGGEGALKPLYQTKRRTEDILARNENGDKLCIKCERWMPVNWFTKNKYQPDALDAWCATCKRDDGMDRDSRRQRRREVRFNITHEQFLDMLEAQGNGCAICKTQTPDGYGWCLDHDHACCPTPARSCGKCVRAVLCGRCNSALGLIKESRETAMAMALYIDTHKSMASSPDAYTMIDPYDDEDDD